MMAKEGKRRDVKRNERPQITICLLNLFLHLSFPFFVIFFGREKLLNWDFPIVCSKAFEFKGKISIEKISFFLDMKIVWAKRYP